jgi:catechol 2,3-dioxygenase-like lactoylglutathione lyase family enzyme
MHAVLYTTDADADRAFFRDVLELTAVDAGGGWLIFALPPAELAAHPADETVGTSSTSCATTSTRRSES